MLCARLRWWLQVVWVRDGILAKVGTYEDVRDDAGFMEAIGEHVVAEDVDTDDNKDAGEPSSATDSGSSGTGSGIKADPSKGAKPAGAVMNSTDVAKGGLTGALPHSNVLQSSGRPPP